MTMASTVSQYLNDRSAAYRVIPHPHSATSRETAHKADVREDRVAKAILLRDEQGMVMVIIPASASLDMRAVYDETGRNHLEMVPESDFGNVFPDCEVGALPPLGPAYGIPTLVDSSLGRSDTVYLESGDHESLVAMDGREFDRLLSSCRHCDLSRDWY
ncbi:YbaK/EbsC family protein [Microbulbifer sp. CAU 1566]|uniref:aminoacyl-tRNA deacylase n=1 Tax=Microbulbifer sp. CAU 1566 TaxID=2933269 RepID=UPI00200608CD|nr:YbaK/EbsC family protein [Microbulbifer sp. CAU 1566]MCK7598720.1 YbaK/EbsC family protein [Microbulbifer sp. CAU 1566]